MRNEIPMLHISEKYMVLVAVVRLLNPETDNAAKIKKALALYAFKEEPFGYTGLYVGLIHAVLDDNVFTYIDSFLSDVESESLFYERKIIDFFQQLKSCKEIVSLNVRNFQTLSNIRLHFAATLHA